jgi:transposase
MRKTTEAGIDVSKAVLDVAVRRDERMLETARFANDAGGHKKLVRWLTKSGRSARVVLESTGTYSLDVALTLQRARGITVMVANPRAIKQFTGALMQRSKTDLTAAVALRDYAIRMPFVAWVPPAAYVLELRGIARRIAALVVERTRERNRLHALQATAEASVVVCNDLEVNIRHLDRRLALLSDQAVVLIGEHEAVRTAFELLVSIPGIAAHSAVQLLPELLVLPETMTVRQWVAHAGLDPRAHQSGTSVNKPRASRRSGTPTSGARSTCRRSSPCSTTPTSTRSSTSSSRGERLRCRPTSP